MEKKQYIDKWYELDGKARYLINDKMAEIESLGITQVSTRYNGLKIASIALVPSALGIFVLCWLFFGIGGAAWGFLFGLLSASLISLITYISLNWNVFQIMKGQRSLQIRARELEADIKDIRTRTSSSKYDLSIEYMDKDMEVVDLGEFKAYYVRTTVTYGKIKDKQRNKTSGEVLVYIREHKVVSLKSYEKIVEEREVPVYMLVDLESNYRKAIVNTLIDIPNRTMRTIATNTGMNIKNLDVRNPSRSEKISYPRKMAKLNGDYYPLVSSRSDELDVFKFFTPRKVLFFKENENAYLIDHIKNNSLYFKTKGINLDWYEIDYTWGISTPEELIEEIAPFRNSVTPMSIDVSGIKADLENTDTLHR